MNAAHTIGAQAPLVEVQDEGREPYYQVRVAGSTEALFVAPGISRCGTITDGVSFWFSQDLGSFVISLEALRQIVRLAEGNAKAEGAAS